MNFFMIFLLIYGSEVSLSYMNLLTFAFRALQNYTEFQEEAAYLWI